MDSSTRGCGRQRSFAFCPLERRLGGGSTTQTGHLRLCHSSCTFKAFEQRSCFCCSSQMLHASHLVELESGVGLRVDSPPRADVRAALRHDHWGLRSTSLFGPVGERDAGVERTRVRARQGHAEWSRFAHEHGRTGDTGRCFLYRTNNQSEHDKILSHK